MSILTCTHTNTEYVPLSIYLIFVVRFLDGIYSNWGEVKSQGSINLHFLIANNFEYFQIQLFTQFFFENYLFNSLTCLLIDSFILLVFNFCNYLWILNIRTLSEAHQVMIPFCNLSMGSGDSVLCCAET